MKSVCKFSLGKFNLLSTLLMGCLLSAPAQAIFIRGNGGLTVYTQGQWMALDILERSRNDRNFTPHYAPGFSIQEKVFEYISRLPEGRVRDSVLRISHTLKMDYAVCAASDFARNDISYTIEDAEEGVIKTDILWYSGTELAAMNVFNQDTRSYKVCYTPMYFEMSMEQRAIINFHEMIYIYLENTLAIPPTPTMVRALVADVLSSDDPQLTAQLVEFHLSALPGENPDYSSGVLLPGSLEGAHSTTPSDSDNLETISNSLTANI